MRTRTTVQQVSAAFAARFGGEVCEVQSHGTGHIHDSFRLCWREGGERRELLVQRFNTEVFRDPEAVMQNIRRVTEHLRAKLEAAGVRDVGRRVLRIQPAPDGSSLFSEAGATYRAFEFIPDTVSFDFVQKPEQPFETGRAFGRFVALLADLPAPRLIETIPGFHDTNARLAALRAAFERDRFARSSELQAERARIETRAELAGYCARLHAAGELSLRVTHNDAKLSNLLFDAVSGEALCVVDLDTVMPGFPAYDFGDLVRTTACPIAEDARDASGVSVRLDYVEELARGYLIDQRAMDAVEVESLAVAPMLVCYELGMRFLTDHLLGDTYFPIDRPGHNLERARVQLALVDALERQLDQVRAAVQRSARRAGAGSSG